MPNSAGPATAVAFIIVFERLIAVEGINTPFSFPTAKATVSPLPHSTLAAMSAAATLVPVIVSGS